MIFIFNELNNENLFQIGFIILNFIYYNNYLFIFIELLYRIYKRKKIF